MSEFELPNSPELYLDPPWKPFKSNGTGDDPQTWILPSTTAGPAPQPIKPKICPFRKKTYGMAGNGSETWQVSMNSAEFFEEEFQPCLCEQCGVWSTTELRCGLIYVRS